MSDRERTRQQMSGLLARWEGSGETLSGFARRMGVSRDRLEYWRRRASRGQGAAKVAFSPVEIVDERRAAEPGVEVVLASGDRLVVRGSATPELLRALVGALRSRC